LGFDLSGFREDILDFSAMLPGAIVRMCEAAGDSHYHFEGRIKTKLLHVDYLLNHCQRPLRAAAPQIAERRKDTWHA
jgi:hypothetical protein